MSDTNIKVHMKHWQYSWNETDESLRVTAQFLWTLKIIFSSSNTKLFLELFRETIYILKF